MIYEAIDNENLEYYQDLIPGPFKHFAHFGAETVIGAAAEAEDIKYAAEDLGELKEASGPDSVIPCGIIMFSLADPFNITIDWLYVDTPFREQEVGIDLLNAAYEMAQSAGYGYLRIRVPDDAVADYMTLRGFEPDSGRHREWFAEIKDIAGITVPQDDESYLCGAFRELTRDVVESQIDKLVRTETPFPIVPYQIDPDHSFICSKGKTIVGVLIVEKVDGVYCLAALTGEDKVRRTLIAQALDSFKGIDAEDEYLHIRSWSDEGDALGDELITNIEADSYITLRALPNGLDYALEDMEETERLADECAEAEENFPKELVITDVEYYSGMMVEDEA
ncbi:MAG: hypothetical protein IJ058_07305 [Lachnospiraceae bacterium]|nr:hypothetical protein [Lachnospiraceae bacterium]